MKTLNALIGFGLFSSFMLSFCLGQHYHWGHALGNSSYDNTESIDTDQHGNVYAGVFTSSSTGVFVAYDSIGQLLWQRNIKGDVDLQILGLHVAEDSSLYLTGTYKNRLIANANAKPDTIQGASDRDIFLLAYDTGGNYKWGMGFSGSGDDHGEDISTDSQGNIYLVGSFGTSIEFDLNSPSGKLNSVGKDDAFVASFTSSGAFRWARNYGGFGFDWGRGIGISDSGYVYMGGTIIGTDDYDPVDSIVIVEGFDANAFLICYDTMGNFQWTRTIGGTGNDFCRGMAMDDEGNTYLVGEYMKTADFDPGPGTVLRTAEKDTDVYIAKYNAQGNFEWVSVMHGSGYDRGWGIDIDPEGNAYITGVAEKNLKPNPADSTFQITDGSSPSAYFAMYDSLGKYIWAFSLDGFTSGESVGTDRYGNVYMGGFFVSTIDADPSSGVAFLTSSSSRDGFLLKYGNKPGSVQTSIKKGLVKADMFKIYPVPAREVLSIDLLEDSGQDFEWKIEVINMQGIKILESEIEAKPSYELNIESISSGMYVLLITHPKGEYARFRFVKE